MIPFPFLILFTLTIFYFSFGVFTLFKNIQSLQNRMFFSLCLHLSFWAFGYAFMTVAPNIEAANFWRMISAIGWCFMYSVFLDFAILVKLESKKWMLDLRRLLIYIPGFYFFIGNLAYEPSRVLIKINNIWHDVYPFDFLEFSYVFGYLILSIIAITIMYYWGKNSTSIMKKKQSKTIASASLLTLAAATFLDMYLPLIIKGSFHYGIIAFSIVLFGTWKAITKYKMMSITTKDAIEYILQTIHDPVILIGNDLLIKEANISALEITGYERHEIKGIPINMLISDTENNHVQIQDLLKAGRTRNTEVGLLTKSNNSVPCLLSGSAINSDLGEIIGIACIFHNITEHKNVEKMLINMNEALEHKVSLRTSEIEKTNALLEKEIFERKKAETELKSSEEKYKSLMKQSTDGILVFDPYTLEIIDSNEKACSILDYTEDRINSLTVDRLLSTDRSIIINIVEGILGKTKTLYEEITTIKVNDGAIKTIEYSAVLVQYNSKTFIMATLSDVTEKLSMENRKQQMVKMESLGTLAGGIAHDFNNILAGIIGYTQLSLEDLQQGFPIEDNLNEVLKLGERSKKLISQILTFSRSTILEPRIINMRTIIIEVLNMIKTTVPNTIDINYNFEGNYSNVLADPAEMHQLIMNLCINAKQALVNNNGVIQVTVTDIIVDLANNVYYPDINDGKYIKIQVMDTGCGMENSVKERVFEPFYTTNISQGGTGLGLSIVHGIVRRHKGIIYVVSELNIGSTFTVLLPATNESSKDVIIDNKFVTNSTARILFIDDEESIVNTTEKLLRREGYIVTGVIGGKEALRLFLDNKDSFDIVITDQSMPDMTGTSLIEKLRLIKPDISTILCSGYIDETDNESIKSVGEIEFLLKPISKSELVSAIERVLQKKRANQ